MKTYKYIVTIMTALFLFAGQAWAQTAVSGRVADTDNNPIVGVSVVVKGTTSGTITGADGRYSLNIPQGTENTLVFSFIGLETVERRVNGTVIDVQMREAAHNLEDVVVVGYGTMRRSDLTGSLSTVKVSEVEAAQVSSFDKLLQGRAAGVQVVSGSGAPGGTMNITIRGLSSFNGTSDPLYVVDGIIINTSQERNAMGSGSGHEAQNFLSSINPQDIASMEILKDASATAIYGSLGANGVILITTKRGVSDSPRIEYSLSAEIAQPSKKIPVMDLDEFVRYSAAVGAKEISADTLQGVNWQDYTMRNALSQSHRISISGRGNDHNYYIALGYLSNEGLLRNTDVSQTDARFNYEQSVGKAVKLGAKFTFANRLNSMTQGSEPSGTQNANRAASMMRQMIGSKPYRLTAEAMSYEDDKLVGTDIWLTNYDDLSKENRVSGTAFGEVKIAEWLSYKATFGLDSRNRVRTRWFGEIIDNGQNGRAGISELNSLNYNIDNVLSSSKTFGHHRIDAMVGTTVNYSLNRNMVIQAHDFADHTFRAGGISSARVIDQSYYDDEASSLFSAFTRLLYNYRERYILTATFRADGSSRFEAENRWSYFPSFAFAWRLSEEPFMKNMTTGVDLKLRLGWGMVGNQAISNYQTLATYNSNWVANPNSQYDPPKYLGQYLIGIKPARLSSKDLKWETTEQYNIGLDVGLFANRLTMTIDLYDKKTKDLLQMVSAPPSSGFSYQWVNMGTLQNRGLEFTVDAVAINSHDFTWRLGGNISFNRNKIIDIGQPAAQFGAIYGSAFLGSDVSNNSEYFRMPANIYLQGSPIGLFYGFATNGMVSQAAADADMAARLAYKAQWEAANPGQTIDLNLCKGTLPTYRKAVVSAGDINYIDQNNDGNIDDNDKNIIGDPNPKFIYGFNTSFSYKNLSLSFNFVGSYGNQIVNANLLQENDTAPTNPAANINNIRAEAFRDAWTPENPGAQYPRLRKTAGMASDFIDRIVEDGSYLRIANITLNYIVPIKSKVISNLGVSFTARNPMIWTKYSGWDPDVSSFHARDQKIGVAWMSYPASRAYVFGLNATF